MNSLNPVPELGLSQRSNLAVVKEPPCDKGYAERQNQFRIVWNQYKSIVVVWFYLQTMSSCCKIFWISTSNQIVLLLCSWRLGQVLGYGYIRYQTNLCRIGISHCRKPASLPVMIQKLSVCNVEEIVRSRLRDKALATCVLKELLPKYLRQYAIGNDYQKAASLPEMKEACKQCCGMYERVQISVESDTKPLWYFYIKFREIKS